MTWALEQRIACVPLARLVLFCLANYADAEGRGAFPSIGRLALDSGMSARGVQQQLRALELLGLIVPGNQALPRTMIGRQDRITRVWDLAMPSRGEPRAPRSHESGANGVNGVHPVADSPRVDNPVDNPVDETATGCTARPNGVHGRLPRGAPGAGDPKRSVRDPIRSAPSTGPKAGPEARQSGEGATLERRARDAVAGLKAKMRAE